MRIGFLVLTVLTLLAGCKEEQIKVRPAYATHIVLYQQLTIDQTLLSNYDALIVGQSGWDELPRALMDKAFLYINPWASSQYTIHPEELLAGYWQPGPGDLGQAEHVLEFTPGRPVFCYVWGEQHPAFVESWVATAMQHVPKGVIVDDFGPDRFWWVPPGDSLAAAVAAEIWPGYPTSNAKLYAWIKDIEQRATATIQQQRQNGMLVCNGVGMALASTVQFHEGVGHGKQAWTALTGAKADPYRTLDDGRRHWLQVNELDAQGSLPAPGLAILQRAVQEARLRPGLVSVGLAYATTPQQGGSIYQLPLGSPWADPRNWPAYWDTVQ